MRVNENDFVNNGFQHFRYNYNYSKRWTFEGFTQVQYNEKTRIQLRSIVGAGPRLTISEKEKAKAYLGLAYMFEYNEIKDTSIIHRDNRLSSYLSFFWQPVEQFSLSGTTYYQPIINDLANLRLSSATTLQVKITDKLSLKLSFQITHDERVKRDAPNVPATIYTFLNGIRWDF